jgi:hypothetical protein
MVDLKGSKRRRDIKAVKRAFLLPTRATEQ